MISAFAIGLAVFESKRWSWLELCTPNTWKKSLGSWASLPLLRAPIPRATDLWRWAGARLPTRG